MSVTEREQLEQAIAALEGQRSMLGDTVVDTAIGPMREKLDALSATPRAEQRKLVTVLSADLAGWTVLGEQMDAEDVRTVQKAFFAAVTAPIIERGGRVEKYIGDAVLAVFGVPLAREDDPERAVRAALEMQRALATLRLDVLGEASLDMRIGVHTGPVLATVGQRADDFVVTGDTVNLAARLQAAAPLGSVLISHDTWRHVQGLFDVEPQEPLAVKGKAEPLQAYRVDAVRPRPFRRQARGVAGVETRMIGREAELLTLQNTLQDVIADGELRLITVVGEGGVGKSRLLGEFEQWVANITETVWYFKGRASPDSERQPYGLLRDMLAARFGISESDPLTEVRRKLETALSSPLPQGEPLERGTAHGPGMEVRSAHLIGHLISFDFSDSPHLKPLLDDPRQLREQALDALTAFLKTLAAQGPILMLLEDLHWADDSSLDALNYLAQTLSKTSLFVLAAARPELYERRPHWGEGWVFLGRLDLRPLSKRASRHLVAEILQRAEQVPESLQDLIVTSADGNPFFIEELIKMLVEDGVIDTAGEPWHIDVEKLRQANIPATLTGVLQARLDRLPAEERTVLQQAAVVGPVFWDLAVLACSGELEATDLEVIGALRASLQYLRSRELVFQRETSAFDRALEHTFKHAILRDVTYETVLKRLRRVYHGLVADWLIAQTGERVSEFVGLIADHLEGAGREEEAVSYLLRAGDQARLVHGHIEAIRRYERALAIVEATGDHDRAARTCMRLGITYQNAADYANARQAFDRGFMLWQRAADVLQAAPLPTASHPLRVDWGEPVTLDPTLCADGASEIVIQHLFSGLVEAGYDFEIAPDIARSWQISEDGRTYVFYLRDDVFWSDGTPVTAGDFVYAWRRRLDPARPTAVAAFLFDVVHAHANHRGEIADAAQLGVRAVDERTLVVELEEPVGYFLQLLANAATFPAPWRQVELWGEHWTQHGNIVTNGPFLLESWQAGHSIVLARNPLYHGRFRGNVTRIEANVRWDPLAKLTMYEADELDIVGMYNEVDELDAVHVPSGQGMVSIDRVHLQQRHPDEYIMGRVLTCGYLVMNTSREPLDDPRVRQALVLATDRQALADTLHQGHCLPATGGFVPPGVPGHVPGIGLPYDPERARQLLVEAGYPCGRGFPVIEAVGGKGLVKESAFLKQQWWDNLRIEITWVVPDHWAHHEQLEYYSLHMALLYWLADYPDPDSFLRVAVSYEAVLNSWHNETFEELVRQARQEIDQQERMQLYRQADRILVQNAAIAPLLYTQDEGLRKPWLTDIYGDMYSHAKDIIIHPH